MGVFTNLFAGTMQGGASKSLATQLYASPEGGFTPDRPGELTHVRTVPVIHNIRPFSPVEAEVLEVEASTAKQIAASTKAAYKALGEIEMADATRTEAHYAYRGAVADATLSVKTAHGKYASHLEGQRPKYAEIAAGHFDAAQKADLAAATVRARVEALTRNHPKLMAAGGGHR